jgi:hypothetical protein
VEVLCIYFTFAIGCAALARPIGECTKTVNIAGQNVTALRDYSCFAIFEKWRANKCSHAPQARGDEHSGVERKGTWPAICMKLA